MRDRAGHGRIGKLAGHIRRETRQPFVIEAFGRQLMRGEIAEGGQRKGDFQGSGEKIRAVAVAPQEIDVLRLL